MSKMFFLSAKRETDKNRSGNATHREGKNRPELETETSRLSSILQKMQSCRCDVEWGFI